jgi:hypothetical protein
MVRVEEDFMSFMCTAYRAHGTCYRGQNLVPVTEHMVPIICRGQYLVPLTVPMVPVSAWYLL